MKFISGFFKFVGVVVILIFVVGALASVGSYDRNHADAGQVTLDRGKSSPALHAHNYCNEAQALELKSSQSHGSARTQYTLAVSGLAKNEQCDNDNMHLINEGFLLSMKGLSEHYLPEGDAQTDLNQANALLVKCQTTPGIYGTHIGALCETQEMNNIKATTNWAMNG